jgi:CspA family cold shock protein
MESMSSVFEYGTVKVYFPLKGYGFITREKGKDLFFFRTAFENESAITEGNPVKFKIDYSDTRGRATDIVRIG